MAWEKRGSGSYYYQSRRENGRVVKIYVGRGDVADSIAALASINHRRREADRQKERAKREALQKAEAVLRQYANAVDTLTRAALEGAGYHCHARGAWRKRRKESVIKKVTAPALPAPTEMTPATAADILLRANAGEANISRQTITDAMDALPLEYRPQSNMEEAAVDAFLAFAYGDNFLMQEMARRDLAKKRQEIAGPNASPLEEMLAGRVALTWLQAETYNAMCSSEGNCTLTQSAHRLKRADTANRQFLATVKTLATVRRLSLPNVQLNIATNGGQQINVAGDVNSDGAS